MLLQINTYITNFNVIACCDKLRQWLNYIGTSGGHGPMMDTQNKPHNKLIKEAKQRV